MKKLILLILLLTGCATPCPDVDTIVFTEDGQMVMIRKGFIDQLPEVDPDNTDEMDKIIDSLNRFFRGNKKDGI